MRRKGGVGRRMQGGRERGRARGRGGEERRTALMLDFLLTSHIGG